MNRCSMETLAQTPAAHVERCRECGSVTIHVGPLSFRLEERALGPFWTVLAEADARLDARRTAERGGALRPLSTVPRGQA